MDREERVMFERVQRERDEAQVALRRLMEAYFSSNPDDWRIAMEHASKVLGGWVLGDD